MGRKILLLFILIFMFSFSTCFAYDFGITIEDLDVLLDYASENIYSGFFKLSDLNEENINNAKERFANESGELLYNVLQNFSSFPSGFPVDANKENITAFIGFSDGTPYIYLIFNSTNHGTINADFLSLSYNSTNNKITVRQKSSENDTSNRGVCAISIRFLGSQVGRYDITSYTQINLNISAYTNVAPTYDDVYFYHPSFLGFEPLIDILYSPDNNITKMWLFNGNYIYNGRVESGDIPLIPPDDSGDISGDNSGDSGGGTVIPSGDSGGGTTTPDYSEKLDNIQGSIDNVNQNLDIISGELNEINNNLTTVPELSGEIINSGDIIGALGFEFAEDPYSNFWLELTTGLGNAFTDEVRSIDVQFRENTHEINLDNFSIQLPGVLKVFLTTTSTVFISWKMLKYWKIIVDNITSGNMDEVLSMNEEERHH